MIRDWLDEGDLDEASAVLVVGPRSVLVVAPAHEWDRLLPLADSLRPGGSVNFRSERS
jgi:hypothetical protein